MGPCPANVMAQGQLAWSAIPAVVSAVANLMLLGASVMSAHQEPMTLELMDVLVCSY